MSNTGMCSEQKSRRIGNLYNILDDKKARERFNLLAQFSQIDFLSYKGPDGTINVVIKVDNKDEENLWLLWKKIDYCLEFGQLYNCRIKIYVEIKEGKNDLKEKYLEEYEEYVEDKKHRIQKRRALNYFVSIDGKIEGDWSKKDYCVEGEAGYGDIYFLNDCTNIRDNANKVLEIWDDAEVRDDVKKNIERMGFNVHLSYKKDLSGIAEKIDEFFDAEHQYYNYFSSIECAISLKNTIKSCELITDINKPNDLEWLEHRRWIIEKVTDGWMAPLVTDENNVPKEPYSIDYDCCIENIRKTGKAHDSQKKLHPCIQKSSENKIQIADEIWDLKEFLEGKRSKVVTSVFSRTDLSGTGCDELEEMSVKLHWKVHNESIGIRSDLFTSDDWVTLEKNNKNRAGWKWYRFCVRNIVEGNRYYCKQYNRYERNMRDECFLKSIPEKEKALENIRQRVHLIIEDVMRRNYKDNDYNLIGKIPFIMTYSSDICLSMAFDDARNAKGSNDAIFKNVASATIINPKKITFFYRFDKTSNEKYLCDKIAAVGRYFKSHNLQCGEKGGMTFVIGFENCPREKVESLKETLNEKEIDYIVESVEENSPLNFLENNIDSHKEDWFDVSTSLYASPTENAGKYLGKLSSMNVKRFETDTLKGTIQNVYGSEQLSYIDFENSVYIDDLKNLAGVDLDDKTLKANEYVGEYEKLWELYSNSVENCFYDSVAEWGMCSGNKKNGKKLLFEDIKAENLTDKEGKALVKGIELNHSGDAVEVTKEIITEKDIGILTDHDAFVPGGRDRFMEWLKKRYVRADKEKHWILKLSYEIDEWYNNADQTTKDKITEVFNSSGNMLEIHTYYDSIKTGAFNDVAIGYKANWYSTSHPGAGIDVNEIDGIFTKGFRTIFVECKDKIAGLENSIVPMLYKLKAVADYLGIGTIPVLVYNSENLSKNKRDEAQLILKAESMGIKIIHKEDEIKNIGETLEQLLDN